MVNITDLSTRGEMSDNSRFSLKFQADRTHTSTWEVRRRWALKLPAAFNLISAKSRKYFLLLMIKTYLFLCTIALSFAFITIYLLFLSNRHLFSVFICIVIYNMIYKCIYLSQRCMFCQHTFLTFLPACLQSISV